MAGFIFATNPRNLNLFNFRALGWVGQACINVSQNLCTIDGWKHTIFAQLGAKKHLVHTFWRPHIWIPINSVPGDMWVNYSYNWLRDMNILSFFFPVLNLLQLYSTRHHEEVLATPIAFFHLLSFLYLIFIARHQEVLATLSVCFCILLFDQLLTGEKTNQLYFVHCTAWLNRNNTDC